MKIDKLNKKSLNDITNVSKRAYDGLFRYSDQIGNCREILNEYKNNGGY
jgi:hypothetical protein